MSRDNQRRRVIVEGFQTRFIFVQLVWAVGALVVFAAAFIGLLGYGASAAGPTVAPAIADDVRLIQIVLFSLLAGLIAILAAVFVRMSHRVAGPLHQFREAFRAIGDGRLDIIVDSRSKDYLKPEQAQLNAMIAALRERVQACQITAAALAKLIADRREDPRPPTHADIDALQTQVQQLSSAVSRFVVS